MPIYKVTAKEEITWRVVVYLDAPSEKAADDWASKTQNFSSLAADLTQIGEWGSVEEIKAVAELPAGAKLTILKPGAPIVA